MSRSIITFGTMAAKAAIKDVGRAMDMPYSDVDRIAKMVPTTLNIKLDDALTESVALQEAYQKDPQVRQLLVEQATHCRLEPFPRR